MKLTSVSLAAIILILLFGGISFTSAMNWWQTESTKVPASYQEGEAAGQYDPADIRGSYTFGEISDLFAIPLTDLQTAFRLPVDVDPATYPLKSLEALYADLPIEMGTGAVRMFVAFYKGLPYELSTSEEAYLFPEAVEVLQHSGQLRPEQAVYLAAHSLPEDQDDAPTPAPVDSTPVPADNTGAAAQPTEHAAPDKMVNGKTTFQNLLDWGVPQETIEQVMGEPMPAAQTVIKDFLSQEDLEFSSLKTKFQAEVDQAR